ncbi:MAG TPA: hypothetical protein VLZ84_02570 [Asticcacaulis sp.]|nr:hypothetical protein [Asticcacaulis sp.]
MKIYGLLAGLALVLTSCQTRLVPDLSLNDLPPEGCPASVDMFWPAEEGRPEQVAHFVPRCNYAPFGGRFAEPQFLAINEVQLSNGISYARTHKRLISLPQCDSEGCRWYIPALLCKDEKASVEASVLLEIDTQSPDTYISLEDKVRAYNLEVFKTGIVNPAWNCVIHDNRLPETQ